MIQEICSAIQGRNLIEFYYKNLHRIVEPFTVGVNTRHNDVLSAYQVRGESEKDDIPCWRLFKIDDISSLRILDERFNGNRFDYRKGDSRMIRIYCEI